LLIIDFMSMDLPADAEVDRLFGALADPTRRRIVQLLRTRPLRAGELAAAAGASAPATSRHLRVLLRAGLVADERDSADARARVFRLRPQSVTALQAWLDQLQAHWDEQLASFKSHVDQEQHAQTPHGGST
jgi:DNA-binding transcriptional ArsR family regulator